VALTVCSRDHIRHASQKVFTLIPVWEFVERTYYLQICKIEQATDLFYGPGQSVRVYAVLLIKNSRPDKILAPLRRRFLINRNKGICYVKEPPLFFAERKLYRRVFQNPRHCGRQFPYISLPGTVAVFVADGPGHDQLKLHALRFQALQLYLGEGAFLKISPITRVRARPERALRIAPYHAYDLDLGSHVIRIHTQGARRRLEVAHVCHRLLHIYHPFGGGKVYAGARIEAYDDYFAARIILEIVALFVFGAVVHPSVEDRNCVLSIYLAKPGDYLIRYKMVIRIYDAPLSLRDPFADYLLKLDP